MKKGLSQSWHHSWSTRILVAALLLPGAVFAQGVTPADRKAANTPGRTGGMMADSPVTFPKEGALPSKYPPDVKVPSEPAESDYYIFGSPCRSLAQIRQIQGEMPRGAFTPPPPDGKHLRRTRQLLTDGGELRILALGDSIVNDTMRSGWVALLGETYPKARIEATVYVRGGGGCQHFKQESRVGKYILPRKPDLVLIGGISQADVGSIREVIHQLRAGLPEVEIVLVTGAFGTTDPREVAALAGAPHSGTGEYGRALQSLAAEERCAYLNLTAPWAEYIRSSGQHPHRFYRDAVHANEFGEQILAQAMLAFFTAKETAFHVSPSGNDAGSGTREQPFATLTKALAATRALPAGQGRKIVVRGGKYWNVSLMLRPEDSGLSLEAEPGETPVLYGGQRLTGWVKDGERCFAAALPALPVTENEIKSGLALPRWEVRLLLVNGQTRPRGRFPETGTLTHQTTFDVPWMSTTGGGWKRKPTGEELTTLRYQAGDLPAGLEVRDAEVTVYHMWDESCVGIAAHDAGKGLLRLAPATGHPPGAFGVKKFVLWNTREGLTKPGQWYHDRVQNRIVYWPLPDEDLSQAEVVVPTRTQVLRLQGSAGQPIRQVTVRGLTVTATTTPLITGGFAAAAFNGAVSLENAEDCALDQITVRGVAGHGMDAARNCVRTRVTRSEVTDCGAGGIYVGGTGALISHNRIHGIGRAYPSALGIYRGGRDCVVRHNEIHDCPYSAINYGGTGNVVEYNLIYDCMKVLHDGAAIYMFAARDCVLRGNVARDIVDTGGYGASAYYLDERSTGCVVEHNLSLRVARPLHNHMATNNLIRHNVFVVEGDAKLTFPRSADFTLAHNLLYATGKIRVEGLNAVTNWTQNLFFSESGKFEAVRLKDYAAGSNAESLPEGIILLHNPDSLPPKDQLGAAILRSAGLNPAPPETRLVTPDRTPSGVNLPLPR